MFVQFSDDTHTRIVSVFANAQDPEIYPNQGEVEEDDPRYQAFIHPELQPENILKAKQAQKAERLAQASQAMTPFFLALQLGDASDDEALKAKEWQTYYRALSAVDVTVQAPAWPEMPN